MRNATKAVIAGVAGLALLTGGAGSLAYWTTQTTGSSVTITSGTLSIGSISDASGWTITQNAAGIPTAQTTGAAYTPGTTQIVPGDVLTKTISVPVTLTGADNKATLSVAQVTSSNPNALDGVLQVAISSVGGNAGTSVTVLPSATAQSIPVVVSVTFPWGTAGAGNLAQALSTAFQASYTLTQVPAAS